MKVTREKAVFVPVVITIESQEELNKLDAQLDAATNLDEVTVESPLFDLWEKIHDLK